MEGKFRVLAESKHKFEVATIYVTSDDGSCLLSSDTAQELVLLSFHLNQIKNNKPSSNPASPPNLTLTTNDKKLQRILNNHATVFSGLGKLRNRQIELAIDDTVPPVAQPQGRIPFHLRKKVESETDKLLRNDIIEEVPEGTPTDWVSPLCVDMRVANTAINNHLLF